MGNLLEELLQVSKSGQKIEFEVVATKPDLHNVVMRYTRLGKSGEGMEDADYIFDFTNMRWEKELHHISGVEQGSIPEGAAEQFLQEIAFVLNLEAGFYRTGTERYIPATEEEQYTLGIETLRRTSCEFVIAALYYRFKWIAEADTDDPYGKIYQALEALRSGCGL